MKIGKKKHHLRRILILNNCAMIRSIMNSYLS